MCIITLKIKNQHGIFDRLSDFGDREQIKTTAMRIDIGLQQIEQEFEPHSLKGLCFAVADDIEYMRIQASKLSHESLASLKVRFRGQKYPISLLCRKLQKHQLVL